MAIYDLLPKFYQVEVNTLKGLQPGFVVSQMPVKSGAEFLKKKNNYIGEASEDAVTRIANGHIVSISAEGIVDAVADAPLFIVYNEPMVTYGPTNAYRFYSTDLEGEHLRLVQLIPGDEWMSDMPLDLEAPALSGRVVEVTTGADWYSVNTLADGTSAKHYMFIK